MDYAKEINALAGETLAIQRFLIALTSRLSIADPHLDRHIRDAFNETASLLEKVTIVAGRKVPPEHLAHSLRVIEEMRTAALGNPNKPKRGV